MDFTALTVSFKRIRGQFIERSLDISSQSFRRFVGHFDAVLQNRDREHNRWHRA